MIKNLIYKACLLLPLIVLVAAFFILRHDFLNFFSWWLLFLVLGFSWWPLAGRIVRQGDHGWILAKVLGPALSAYIAFVLHHILTLPQAFQQAFFILCQVFTALLVWFFFLRKYVKTRSIRSKADRQILPNVLILETIFLLALLFWTFARGLKPDLDSLEKFMNLGFMNSIWRSEHLPAPDMWLSSHSINYYYFGQYFCTWLGKLVGVKPLISYQLSMATMFALTFVLAGSFSFNYFLSLKPSKKPKYQISKYLAFILGGFLVTLGGNQHAFLFADSSPAKKLTSFLMRINILPGSLETTYWFANSTRYIGYNPPTGDKTIHEFPAYSFLVADLHAHVINLVFVLALLLIIFLGYQRLRINEEKTLRIATDPYLIILSFFLALFIMTNFWDFIIYFALICLLIFLRSSQLTRKITTWKGLLFFILQALALLLVFLRVKQPVLATLFYLLIAVSGILSEKQQTDGLSKVGARMGWLFFYAHLLALPFNLHFVPMSKKILPVTDSTPLAQLWVLWGAHFFAALVYLLWLINKNKKPRLHKIFPPLLEQRSAASKAEQGIFTTVKNLFSACLATRSDQIILAFILMGIFLIVLPELVYVVDIYSGDFKRANTMFKFTYQAHLLLSLAWAVAIIRISTATVRIFRSQPVSIRTNPKNKLPRQYIFSRFLPIALLILTLAIPFWFMPLATKQWLGEFQLNRYKGLDALSLYALKDSSDIAGSSAGELAADVAAIKWFDLNCQGQPIILEAPGDSYTDYNRISAFTGLPTVIGWQTHEWLWRTSNETPDAFSQIVLPRQQQVQEIYTTANQDLRRQLLALYEIEYIVVGSLEREKYSDKNEGNKNICLVREDLIAQLADVVFEQVDLRVYQVNN